MLRLEQVAKGFAEGTRWRQVLDGLDLDVAQGEFVAITGASGSGKSTLLNVLGLIDPPDRGRLIFRGIDITRLDERAGALHRRRHLGFVFQFFNLVPTLTVSENLRLPLALLGRDSPQVAARWLERLGLADRGGASPELLSGGEQQRVAIARALVHEPAVVLADEPTGNLDAETGAHVVSLLRELCTDSGTTLVVVTHSAEVAAAADRTLALDHGRLHASR